MGFAEAIGRIRRSVLTSLLLIVVVAFCCRSYFAWDYARHRPRQALSVIPFLFEPGNIAYSLATGKGFASPFKVETGPTAWTTPVYPLILAELMRLFGPYSYPSYVAAVLVNIVFSSLVCVPVYFIGRRIGGTGLGATAAWLWALFPNAILLTFSGLEDTCLPALLGACLLLGTLWVDGAERRWRWAAYGLLWGAALMTDAALVSLLPFLAGWALFESRQRGEPWLRHAAIAAGLAIACCIPWTVRNYLVFDTLIPLRTGLGVQLWAGNNPDAQPVYRGEHHPINDQAEREQYITLGEVAYDREKEHDALAYMTAHPRREAGLIARRFVSFWTGGTTAPIRDFLHSRSAWFRYVVLFNVATALAAVVGIFFLARDRNRYLFPAAVYPIVFPWAYYLTLAQPRYRHPIDPVIMVLAAVCLQACPAALPRVSSIRRASRRLT